MTVTDFEWLLHHQRTFLMDFSFKTSHFCIRISLCFSANLSSYQRNKLWESEIGNVLQWHTLRHKFIEQLNNFCLLLLLFAVKVEWNFNKSLFRLGVSYHVDAWDSRLTKLPPLCVVLSEPEASSLMPAYSTLFRHYKESTLHRLIISLSCFPLYF